MKLQSSLSEASFKLRSNKMQVRKSDLKKVVKEVLNEEGMLTDGDVKKDLAALNGHILEFVKDYPKLRVSKSLKKTQDQLRAAYKKIK